MSGENHIFWKGDKATYSSLHKRITRHFLKPEKCDWCGIPKTKKNGLTNIQWANISGKYLFKRDDWLGLCSKCHKKQENNVKNKRLHSHK